MKLYVTNTSPCARLARIVVVLARIVVVEKGLEDRVEISRRKRAPLAAPTIKSTPRVA